MERLVGNAQGQAAVEGEITLPGGLREEARVLSAGCHGGAGKRGGPAG